MGRRFQRWLGRPSTHCFLRRLLSIHDPGDSAVCPINFPSKLFTRELSGAAPTDDTVWRLSAVNAPVARRRRSAYDPRAIARRARARKLSSDDPFESLLGFFQPSDSQQTASEAFTSIERAEAQSPFYVHWDDFSNTASQTDSTSQTDFASWISILNQQERLNGLEGVRHVWTALKSRNITLPTNGKEADELWRTFIHACIASPLPAGNEAFIDEIIDYATDLKVQTGSHWPGLIKCMLGRLLLVAPHQVPRVHEKLVQDFELSADDLRSLSLNAFATLHRSHSYRSDGPRQFKYIYEHASTRYRSVYDTLIPKLYRTVWKETQYWHKYLLSHGDGPSPEIAQRSRIQQLFREEQASKKTERRSSNVKRQSARQSYVPAAETLLDNVHRQAPSSPPLTRASMSSLVGDVHGIKAKEFSDDFLARLFATYALPLELIIGGLGVFGINRIGPVALRQLALRAKTRVAFLGALANLRQRSIRIDSVSKYARLLQEVANYNHDDLFDALLSNDQHPESFENPTIQERLLASFLRRQDWPNAHIALMTLSFTHSSQGYRAWNKILQHYISERNYKAVQNTSRHMRVFDIKPTSLTLRYYYQNILTERRPSKRPAQGPHDIMQFMHALKETTAIFIYASKKGQHVVPSSWVELLKRYGMSGDWQNLERLILWLVSKFSTQRRASLAWQIETTPVSSRQNDLDMKIVFTKQMLQAFIHWGFRIAATQGHLQSMEKLRENGARFEVGSDQSTQVEPWARGIALVKSIAPQLDIKKQTWGFDESDLVRDALVTRLWILFGPANSRKATNWEAMRHNQLSLAHYVKYANEMYDSNLFSIDPELLQDDGHPEAHATLMTAIFGNVHLVSRGSPEYADVAKYARDIASGDRPSTPSGSRISDRLRQWRRSRYRLHFRDSDSSPASSVGHSHRRLQARQWRVAHLKSLRPPPNRRCTQAPA